MKYWKQSFLAAVAFFSVGTTVLVSSCIDNSCTNLKCQNGGTCAENFCRCRAGFEGPQCETKTMNRFIGTYSGTTRCSDYATRTDTVTVSYFAEPNVVKVVRANDKANVYTGVASENRITINQLTVRDTVQNVNVIITNDNKKMEMFVEYLDKSKPDFKDQCSFYGFRP